MKLLDLNMYNTNEKKLEFDLIINKLENRPIYQPELSIYSFYGNNNELEIIDCYITNKLIKRETFIKALNILKKFYLNIYMTFMEDSMMNYIIYNISRSLFFLKKIGYYYIKSSISLTTNLKKINELRLKFSFIYLQFIFEYSKNSKYQKDIVNKLFTNINKAIVHKMRKIKKNKKFFKKVIKIFLNCSFISDENKKVLKHLKYKLKIKK